MSMDMKKERMTEMNHRQKVTFSTLLLPVLVAWNTLTLEAVLLPVITLKYYIAATLILGHSLIILSPLGTFILRWRSVVRLNLSPQTFKSY